jgi:hypothetical protein
VLEGVVLKLNVPDVCGDLQNITTMSPAVNVRADVVMLFTEEGL